MSMELFRRHSLECNTCGDGRGYICVAGVLAMVPRSRMTLWRMEKAGSFPPRLNFSERYPIWLESEVREWIANRPRGIQPRPTA